MTPLDCSASNNNLRILELLLNHGASIINEENNKTALHWAAMNGHITVAEFLINKGTNVNSKDLDHDTPLHYAAQYYQHQMYDFLVKNGADEYYENIEVKI